jgi:hypothetical protein
MLTSSRRSPASTPELAFQGTAIGCGLAGYRLHQIAPTFADAPANVVLPDEFKSIERAV